jgi:pimeloyl-ACP methyl ester carboxylesterase
MHLERVTREPSSPSPRTPVVFVHGAWHGAWCWAEHFLDFFARRGYPAHAFDLRGHGGSDGGHRLRWTRLADYVSDLAQVVGGLGQPPVLVGHSMGGAVVQKYVQTRPAAAAVFMASLPPAGGLPATLRLAARHPVAVARANLTLRLRHLVGTPALAREAFFSDGIPADRLAGYFSRLQDESYRVFLDMLALDRPRPGPVRMPVLVLGAERDTFFTRKEIEDTARAYHADPAFFPMAHDMMLEDGWEEVAGHIVDWLDRTLAVAHRRTGSHR